MLDLIILLLLKFISMQVQFEDDDPELSKSAVSEVYKVRICLNPTEEHGGDIYWQLEKV